MTLHSMYKNTPKALTGVFLALAFYFLARTLNGYSQDQKHLMVLADLALSIGLFTVGIPASLLLLDDVSETSENLKLKFLAVSLSAVTLILCLWMVFSKNIEGYFGFEYAPEISSLLFLSLFLSSILISLIFLLISLQKLTSNQVLLHWPLAFHFAACGVGLSLVFLLGMQSLGPSIQTEATIVLSEFLRRLILTGAMSQIVMTLVKKFSISSKRDSLVYLAGSILFLVGFQSSTLRTGGSELLYVFNQSTQLMGLGLILGMVINILAKAWKAKSNQLLNEGQWVGHGTLLIGLTLTMISSGPFEFLTLGGITQNFQLLILVIATPLLMQNAWIQSQSYPSQSSHLVNALSWSGLFICFISILIMSPFGGSLIVSQNPTFKPILGIMMSGLCLLILGYLISIWNHILHDWI